MHYVTVIGRDSILVLLKCSVYATQGVTYPLISITETLQEYYNVCNIDQSRNLVVESSIGGLRL